MAPEMEEASYLFPRPPPPRPTASREALTDAIGLEGGRQDHTTGKMFGSWWWWWEIGAALLSVMCLLLIITLLIYIDGTVLREWPLPFQPNSILAALTTIMKTALLVPVASCIGQLKWQQFTIRPTPLDQLQIADDASRGPWGSAIILCKFVGRIRSSAILGLALTSILALGIDPSVQQIINLEPKEIKVANSSVLISRAEAYYSKAWDVNDDALLSLNSTTLSKYFPGVKICKYKQEYLNISINSLQMIKQPEGGHT